LKIKSLEKSDAKIILIAMNKKQLKNIIKLGEVIQTEFKTCTFQLSNNVFETICAFLNRGGGHLILGVSDEGTIEGVLDDSIDQIINNVISNCNNLQKLNPTFYLSPEVIDIEKKKVIYIYVPESSQVHYTVGRIFDRNSDGDFDITDNQELVTQLYIRKQTTYSENKIYPHLTLGDLKTELFSKIRKLVKNQRSNHPWMGLNNDELLKSAGLWKKDYQSGNDGYTLASVVLLGKEEVIQSILPHYKTDAILRVENIDRYDDRDDIRCNLIEAYERLSAFIKKHLPDKFYAEDNQRINLRDKIFREIIGNILVHREFSNSFPAKLIIESDHVLTENWNKPHGNGRIDPANFSPYPKNPTIAKFFKEIGWVEELGSGIRNITKYCNLYGSKGDPEFIEGDIFKAVIPVKFIISSISEVLTPKLEVDVKVSDPVNDVVTAAISDGVNEGLIDGVSKGVKENIIKVGKMIVLDPGINAEEIRLKIDKSKSTVERYLKILKDIEIIEYLGPAKTGGYHLTQQTKEEIKKDRI
jgi:ATP-dependent DNA helicase RecG